MSQPAPTFADLVEIAIAEAQDVRPSLSFNDGDVSEAMVHAGAAMFDHVVAELEGGIRRLFFGGAHGPDLDEVIMDRLRLERIKAVAATGNITFRRETAGTAGVIPAGTQVATPMDRDGRRKVYTLTTGLPYDTGPFVVTGAAAAAIPGRDGACAGPVSMAILTDLGDPNISASTDGFAGGRDEESDGLYLVRAVDSWKGSSRGSLRDLERGALENTGATSARVVEDINSGIVTVMVADQSGESTSALEYEVRKNLEGWRAAGSLVQVRSGDAAQLELTCHITKYAAGFCVEAAAPVIADSITNRVNSLRVGQDLTLDMLKTAAIVPFASEIYAVEFAAVLDDVEVSSGANIRSKGRHIRLAHGPAVVDG